jgi:hypothetical protein
MFFAIAGALLYSGNTYIAKYVHDITIFLDWAHRIVSGQIPNRDFHTPLGPLAFLLPALGYFFSGSLGGMMPLATAAFGAVVTPLAIYVCCSRLPALYAVAFGGYILLLMLAPLNPGDPAYHTTFAMFYNRFCSGLISMLFLFLMPRREGIGNTVADMAVAASLVLLMLYLKASYAAIGLAFLGGLLIFPATRRMALGALIITAAATLVIELFWSGTLAYVGDIRFVGQVNGIVRGGIFSFVYLVFEHAYPCLIFAAVMLVAYLRGARPEVLLICFFIGGAGLVLLNQNAGGGIATLIPAALIATLCPARDQPSHLFRPAAAAVALFAALLIPPVLGQALALAYQFNGSAKSVQRLAAEVRLDGLVVREESIAPFEADLRAMYRSGSTSTDVVNELRFHSFRQPLGQPEYIWTVKDGMDLLQREQEALAGKVYVFDMGNPFNALLRRQPPTGVESFNHGGRTMSETVHRPAELMLSDVDVVLVPKASTDLLTTQLLKRIYGAYVRSNFEFVAETNYWHAYRRKSTI